MTELEKIKELRIRSNLGVLDCKEALEKAGGDLERALELLKQRGVDISTSKIHRATKKGLIDSYIHHTGELGVLVEVACETDFVAKTEVFKRFVKDIALHIGAMEPLYISEADIPEDEKEKIKDLDSFVEEKCLLEQAFIKDQNIKVKDYLKSVISQIQENIVIKRFVIFRLGENG